MGDLSGEWDKERLAQLVSNLAANAVEHGGGERIHMVVRDDAALAVFEINNRGEPIASELLPSIFDPLVHGRQDASGEASRPLGLGLFIARENYFFSFIVSSVMVATGAGQPALLHRLPTYVDTN